MAQGTTQLMSCLVKEYADDGTYTVNLSGEPHARGLVEAAAASWNRVTGRKRPDTPDLEAMIGYQATIVGPRPLAFGGSDLYAIEGRIGIPRSNDGLMIVPKGSTKKGYLIPPRSVIDLFDGYGGTEAAVELTAQVQSALPELKPLTQERLEQLPRADTDEVTLAVYGTNGNWGAPESLWLFTTYWDVDDILDREILLVPPAYATSEAGSMFGRDLLRMNVGEVVGFEPLPWPAAYDLTMVADHHEAVRFALSDAKGRDDVAAA